MQDKAWGFAENLAPKQKMANEAYLDRLTNRTSLQSTEGFISVLIPREARRAEGPPSVARFINLSRGDRARIAKGGQISICPYIFRWCPHSCLATKPNRDR